jgi:hypothetical protein
MGQPLKARLCKLGGPIPSLRDARFPRSARAGRTGFISAAIPRRAGGGSGQAERTVLTGSLLSSRGISKTPSGTT